MVNENPDSYARFMRFARMIADFGFFLTTFSCLLLIYMTIFKVKRNFGSYKYLLITFPTLGILFAALEVLVYPTSASHNCGYFLYTSVHPLGLSKNVVTWLVAGFGGFFTMTICNLSIQFLYRYWAIFKESKLRLFQGYYFLIWLLYSLSFGVLWAVGIYYLDTLDTYSIDYFKEEMLKRYDLKISEVSGIAIVAYGSDGSPRWSNILSILNMTVIMMVQYAIMTYCGVRMYIEMDEKVQILSPSLRRMHSQFFKTLVLQIVIPTVTLFSPVVVAIYLPLLDLKVDLPSGILITIFPLFSGMDAFFMMYIVQDYRIAFKSMCKNCMYKIIFWTNRFDSEASQSRVSNMHVVPI